MSVLAQLTADVAADGFDLVGALATADWNATATAAEQLPDFDRGRALVVVVGNSGALWPRFVAALARDPALAAERDPLDRHTERAIETAVAATGVRAEIRFGHRPPYPPIQRLADAAGLVRLQATNLCAHPRFGPWIAMRAVVVLDADGPPPPARLAAPCDCRGTCLPAFERAAALGFDPDDETTWRAWVAIRDACPLGREFRYPDDQIRYHYGKDRRALMRAVDAARQRQGADPSP